MPAPCPICNAEPTHEFAGNVVHPGRLGDGKCPYAGEAFCVWPPPAPGTLAPVLIPVITPAEKSLILLSLVSRSAVQMEISMHAEGREAMAAAAESDKALTLAKRLNDAWKGE